jgi:hypothetical protein
MYVKINDLLFLFIVFNFELCNKGHNFQMVSNAI